jgi:conjugal transfer pilus assembly protein TraV
MGSIALATLTFLGGCASFGGNVKGSFSCAAPDGICAPSSSIDDRALAMIAGEGGAGETSPAGPYMATRPKSRASHTAAAGQRIPVQRVDPSRTQERVLRIVFQPYIDQRGRLHEASAVHAVVQGGEWQQQALAYATPIPERNAQTSPVQLESLAEALDRADPVSAHLSAIDPNLPDAAVVAAARARRVDPVDAIKADVAARLAPKTGLTPTFPSSSVRAGAEAAGRKAAEPLQNLTSPAATASATAKPNAPPGAAVPATPTVKTASGAAATERVKASPEYRASATAVEAEARAAGQTGALPPTTEKGTLRAPGFPGVVPEGN